METPLQEIEALRRKGYAPLEIWKFIVRSKKHRTAWQTSQCHGKEDVVFWEQVLKHLYKLKYGGNDDRFEALYALGQLERTCEEILPDILRALQDLEPEVRCEAITTLIKLGRDHEKTIPALLERLQDKDPYVCSHAATILGELKREPEQVVSALFQQLQQPQKNERVQRSLIIALGQFGPKAKMAIPLLQTMQHHVQPQLQDILRQSLRQIQK